MDSGACRDARGKRRRRDPEHAEIAGYAREVAHLVEVELREALTGENGERAFEVLWVVERRGHCFSFIHASKNGGRGLSNREAEIGAYQLRGLSAKEIATKIRRSVHTVEHHIERLHGKLGPTGCGPVDLLSRREVLVHFARDGADPEGGPEGKEGPRSDEGEHSREPTASSEVKCDLVVGRSPAKRRRASRRKADPPRRRKGTQ